MNLAQNFSFENITQRNFLCKLSFAVTWISSCCSIACAGRTQSEWNPYSETQDILHDPKLAHRPLLGLKHKLLLLWRPANPEKNVQQALRDVQSMPNNWQTRQFLNRKMTLHKVQPNVEILHSRTLKFVIYSLSSLNVTSMRSSFPQLRHFSSTNDCRQKLFKRFCSFFSGYAAYNEKLQMTQMLYQLIIIIGHVLYTNTTIWLWGTSQWGTANWFLTLGFL